MHAHVQINELIEDSNYFMKLMTKLAYTVSVGQQADSLG